MVSPLICLLLYLTSVHANPCANRQKRAAPHETDCGKYTYCRRGSQLVGECPFGFIFDADSYTCQTTTSGRCGKPLPAPTQPPCPIVSTTTENPWPPCNDSSTSYFMPDTGNCKSFYICVWGNRLRSNCPKDFHFSASKLICLPKEDADCTESTTTVTTVSTSASNIPTEPEPPSGRRFYRTCLHSDYWFEADPEDCAYYFMCLFGITRRRRCPEHYGFSEIEESCMPAEKSGCIAKPTAPPTKQPNVQCDDDEKWIHSDPQDCTKYYVCLTGTVNHWSCPDDYEFSPTNLSCMPAEKAGCIAKPTAPPTNQPNIQCDDDEEWINSDPQECTKYYVCLMGTLNRWSCPDDLQFSPTKLKCMPKNEAKCVIATKTTTSKPITIQPNLECVKNESWVKSDPEDCRRYYVCSMGLVKHLTCPKDAGFSPTKMLCLSAKEAGCFASTTSISTTTTTAPSTTTQQPIIECGNDEQWIHPDVKDCRGYYVCFMGSLSHLNCPGDLEFSATKLECLPKSEAKCVVTTTTTSTTTPSTTTSQQPVKQCIENDEWIDSDPQDCTKYYVCYMGTLSHLSCPGNLAFSLTALKCLPKNEANCVVTTSTTTSTTTQQPVIQCNDNEEWVDSDPQDCTKYYVCLMGTLSHVSCPGNLEFSKSTMNCLPKNESKCERATTTSPSSTTTEQPDLECSETSVWMHSDPQDCRRFYLCVSGVLEHIYCPRNFDFSPTAKRCLPPQLAGCAKTPTTATTPTQAPLPECTDNISWVESDPEDCTRYYICFTGSLARFTCADNTEFSPYKKRCLPKNEAQCVIARKTTTAPETTTKQPDLQCGKHESWVKSDPQDCKGYFVCIMGTKVHYSCPGNFEFSKTMGLCLPAETAKCVISTTSTSIPTTTTTQAPNTACGEDDTWVKSDPQNCKKYFVCSLGTIEHLACPGNLEFSTTGRLCLPASQAGCVISTTTTTTTTTTQKPLLQCDNNESWVKSDPEYCRRYYVCSMGTLEHLTCPFDYNYDHKKTICLPPGMAPCTIITPSTTTIHTTPTTTYKPITECEEGEDWVDPDPINCRRYYVCVMGKLEHWTCPGDYEFSPTELKCLPKDEANCEVTTTTTTTSSTTTTTTTTTTSSPNTTTLPPKTTTSSPTTTASSPTTTSPSPTTTTSLPTTTKTSPTTSPSSPTTITSSPTTITSSPTTNKTSPTTTTTPKITTAAPPNLKCNEDRNWIDRDPQDCRRYYICIMGNLQHEICPEDEEFSPTKLICLPKSEAKCEVATTTTTTTTAPTTTITPTTTTTSPTTTTSAPTTTTSTPTTTNSSPSTTTSSPTTTTSSPTTTTSLPTTTKTSPTTTTSSPTTITSSPTTNKTSPTTTTTPKITTAAPSNLKCNEDRNWIDRDLQDCRRYYICIMGNLEHEVCPEDEEFSPTKLICLPKSEAKCEVATTTTTISTTTMTPTTTTSSPTTTTSAPTTTTSTPTTTTSLPTTITSSPTTNKTSPTTTTTPKITTAAPPNLKCNEDRNWIDRDLQDCRRYYICIMGYLEHEVCPEDEEFSPTKLTCLPKNEAKCEVATTTTTISTTTITPTTTTSSSTTTTSAPTTTTISPTTTSTSQRTTTSPKTTSTTQPNLECNEDKDWVDRDPQNCRKYYVCIMGTLQHEVCPGDREFSPTEFTCLPKNEAKCEVATTTTTISTTTITPTTTTSSSTTTTSAPTTTTISPTTTSTSQRTTTSPKTKSTTQPNLECNEDKDWVDRDPQNCRKYYVCIMGTLQHEVCPGDREFSPTEFECQAKEDANCISKSRVNPESSVESKSNVALSSNEDWQSNDNRQSNVDWQSNANWQTYAESGAQSGSSGCGCSQPQNIYSWG